MAAPASTSFASRYSSLTDRRHAPQPPHKEWIRTRQAADAVRGRIDWKYLLGLELEDEGFHFSVLSGFRERLVERSHGQVVLDRLLARLSELGFLRAGGRVRTDATHVLALVRDLNRLGVDAVEVDRGRADGERSALGFALGQPRASEAGASGWKGSEPEPIGWLVADRAGYVSAQHRVLMPQHEKFRMRPQREQPWHSRQACTESGHRL